MPAMGKLAHLHSLLKTDSRTQKTGRKLAPGLREEDELRAVPVIHGSSGTPTHLPGTTWATETDLSSTSIYFNSSTKEQWGDQQNRAK